MQLIVPMAGAGRRFVESGYCKPKPLIDVCGVPMVVRAVSDLPRASRQVFVCHAEHVALHQIDKVLGQYFPECHVVVAPGLTAGQACSVRLAAEHLDIEEPVLVAACDNTHLYDRARWNDAISDSAVDCLIWTYRGDPRVLRRPEAYGWVRADDSGRVREVSVKRPLTSTPLADLVVSGSFWFRTAALMLDAIDRLVASGARVNNEFYLDSVPNLLIAEGRAVRTFEVDKYIGWGTPEDLNDFLQWQCYAEDDSVTESHAA